MFDEYVDLLPSWLMCLHLSHNPLTSPNRGAGAEKSFHISGNPWRSTTNCNRVHLRTHWLAVKWYNDQSYSVRESVEWVKADRAQNMRSSSCLLTTMVMTLSHVLFATVARCCLMCQLRSFVVTTCRQWQSGWHGFSVVGVRWQCNSRVHRLELFWHLTAVLG